MKRLFAILLAALVITGCRTDSSGPIEPAHPSNPPGTSTLSSSKSHTQHGRTKLMNYDASQN